MVEYCCGFLLANARVGDDEDEWVVTLIRKSKPDWQKGLLNGVGGHVKDGETPLEAMSREFEEETQVAWSNWQHTITLYGNNWRVHFFRAFCEEDLMPEDQDCDEGRIETHRISQLPKLPTIPNLQWIIPMQLDNLSWPIGVRDLGGIESKDGN